MLRKAFAAVFSDRIGTWKLALVNNGNGGSEIVKRSPLCHIHRYRKSSYVCGLLLSKPAGLLFSSGGR